MGNKRQKQPTDSVCSDCGSDDVQTKMWVNPNTHEVKDGVSDGEDEDNWCESCGRHTGQTSRQDYEEEKAREEQEGD